MKIIIAGDGETGTHLANTLSVENQDIVLMGTDREHLSELDAVSNFITFEGSPMSVTNLMQCGVDNADLFVAVTPDETVNLISCDWQKIVEHGSASRESTIPNSTPIKSKGCSATEAST